MSTPCVERGVEARERVARRDVVGALVADALGRCVSALASRAPVGRAVVVALAARADRRRRSAGRGGPPGRRPGRPGLVAVARRDSCMRGRSRARAIASASSSLTSPGGPPRVDLRASQQPSPFQRFPMPGDVRWSSSASPIGARRVVLAQAAQERALVELGRRGCRGRGAAIRRSKRARASRSSARAPGRRTATTSWSPRARSRARRGAGERAPARARAVDAPGAGHAQVRVDA